MSWKNQSSRTNNGKSDIVNTLFLFSDNPENSFPENLNVKNDVIIEGDLIYGDVEEDDVNITGNLTLTASAIFSIGNIDISNNEGNLDISGGLNLTNDLALNQNAIFSIGDIDISNNEGNLDISGGLNLTGDLNLDTSANLSIGNIDISNNEGNLDISAGLNLTGNLDLNQNAIFSIGNIDISNNNGNLDISGGLNLTGDLNLDTSANLSIGNIDISNNEGNLDISAGLNLTGNLDLTSETSILSIGNIDISNNNGNLDISAGLNLTGDLNLDTSANLSIGNIDISNNNGNLDISGGLNITGDIDMSTNKKITWVDDNQYISGPSTGITIKADAITLDTPSVVVTSITSDKPLFEIINDTNDNTGSHLRLSNKRSDNIGVNSDVAGTIDFFTNNSMSSNKSFGEIKVVSSNVTNTNEKGKMTFGVACTNDGIVDTVVTIEGGTNSANSTTTVAGNLIVNGNLTFTALTDNSVLEHFECYTKGQNITFKSELSHTLDNVRASQELTTAYQTVTGSEIIYKPPLNTTQVIYEFTFSYRGRDPASLFFTKYFIDADEVQIARTTLRFQGNFTNDRFKIRIPITISNDGTSDTANGILASWDSPKTLKIQARIYDSSYDVTVHSFDFFRADNSTDILPFPFSCPMLAITALRNTIS